MQPSVDAFMYLFEYSNLSTTPDVWNFAGANSTGQIKFPITDPCRDYQFRTIAIVRGSDEPFKLVTYRPRAIPVNLPPFIINSEHIVSSSPILEGDQASVIVYVSWDNPIGYTDGDIYGYEAPAIYPIQCQSPEGQLPTPSIDLHEGGGRLRMSLPTEVLESKCRLWAEVRMLPRCVRLEPFSIQQSIELDCERLESFKGCRQDVMPQCTDMIDVSGSGNNATIIWSPHADLGQPLYYHIRYGPAQMQGLPPFATWTIASLHEMRVPSNQTWFLIDADMDVDYGVQICGVYSVQKTKPKFGLIPVTPFICTSCNTQPIESFGRCGECSKIEGPILLGRRCHPNGGIGCTSTIIPSDKREAEVIEFEGLTGENGMKNKLDEAADVDTPLHVSPSLIFVDRPVMTKQKDRHDENLQAPQDAHSMGSDVKGEIPSSTSDRSRATSVDIVEGELRSETNTEIAPHDNANSTRSSTTLTSSTSASTSTRSLHANSSSTAFSQPPLLPQTRSGNISEESDLHQLLNPESCILFNGVICKFGCVNQAKCECPKETHILLENGACIEHRNNKNPSYICFTKSDVKAVWNSRIHALMLRSKHLYEEIKVHWGIYDRVFIEFRRLKRINENENRNSEKLNPMDTDVPQSNKMVVHSDRIIRNGFLINTSFSFYTNQSIDPLKHTYGLRLCVFNRSEIRNPFANNWNAENVQMPSLSEIHFETKSVQNAIATDARMRRLPGSSTLALIIVPTVLIIFMSILLIVLIYLNCSRIKRFYDRRRTRNFQPYTWTGTPSPVYPHFSHDINSFMITKPLF